jgi:hypothetical protein
MFFSSLLIDKLLDVERSDHACYHHSNTNKHAISNQVPHADKAGESHDWHFKDVMENFENLVDSMA